MYYVISCMKGMTLLVLGGNNMQQKFVPDKMKRNIAPDIDATIPSSGKEAKNLVLDKMQRYLAPEKMQQNLILDKGCLCSKIWIFLEKVRREGGAHF